MHKALHTKLHRAWRSRARDFVVMPMPHIHSPTIQIKNVAFENGVYRKAHLELARIKNLDIVHSVMYPRPQFDIPILGIDLVEFEGQPMFAIADACPVTDDLSLPPHYLERVRTLQKKLNIKPVARDEMPVWGQKIFSDMCVMTRDVPLNFVEYAIDLVDIHMVYASLLEPSPDHERIRKNHARFSTEQLRNGKTKAALAMELGLQEADKYMRTVMFDS
jgi:phycocyanobilin:ferredoxin oxidoreductase